MKKNTTRKVIGMPFKKAAEYLLPVDNDTPYGSKRYRTPISKNEFTGTAGSKPEAVVLDIDGTLQNWGSTLSPTVGAWVKKHHDAGRILIVITARTHDYDYARSFDWLVGHLHYPFIGPFCRMGDDPRYASEFKREVSESLGALYTIVGAADDNSHVNSMWKFWATEHPEIEFDLLECGYTPYADWRKDLGPTTKAPYAGYSGYSTYDPYDRWESTQTALPVASHRQAGYSRYDEDIPSFSEPVELDREDRIESRLDLEDDVYAAYPDLTYTEIEKMDVEVLRQMALDADNPETGPLDVEEILDELNIDAPAGGRQEGAA